MKDLGNERKRKYEKIYLFIKLIINFIGKSKVIRATRVQLEKLTLTLGLKSRHEAFCHRRLFLKTVSMFENLGFC